MKNSYEIFKGGLLTRIEINDVDVGGDVQVKFHRRLTDDKGKDIINSSYEFFFTPRELRDFFQPIVDDLKVRFENADSVQERERV